MMILFDSMRFQNDLKVIHWSLLRFHQALLPWAAEATATVHKDKQRGRSTYNVGQKHSDIEGLFCFHPKG